VRAILLDALGTLVALEPPAPRLRTQLARLGAEVSDAQAASAIAAEIAYYRAHLDEGRDDVSLADLRGRCADALAAALPGHIQSLDRRALTDALLASLRFTAFPDVRPALAAWRADGVRLVVVSNWDVSLNGVLARLGIAPLLDGILTSAQAGARKPAPAIFEQALMLAGVSAEHAIHVGDSLEEDVAGAREAGIEPVLIDRDGRSSAPGARTVASLAELAAAPPPAP
jgi:putative hydrolase of the HAD superfamily